MNEKGVVKYSLLSFCWGASVSFNACNYAVDVDKISCSVNCHPSLHSCCPDNHLELVGGVRCPQLIAASKMEPDAYKPGGEVESLLSANNMAAGSEHYLYDQSHGFVGRGDLGNEATAAAVADVFDKAITFLEKNSARHHQVENSV
jgi:dienelactone hydrolase